MAKKKTSTGKKIASKKPAAKTASFTRAEKAQMEKDFLKDFEKISGVSPVAKKKVAKKKVVPSYEPEDLEQEFYRDFQRISKVSQKPSKPRIAPPPHPKVDIKPAKARKAPTKPEKPVKQVSAKELRQQKESRKEPIRDSYKFDKKKPVVDVNLDKARKSTIKKSKKDLYQKRRQIKKKIEGAKTERERKSAINEAYRTSRFLEKANEKLGKKTKKKGYKRKVIREGKGKVQRNVYLWEASKDIDTLIDSGKFKTFIVNGQRFNRSQVTDIIEEFDDMEELGAMGNEYYIEIHQDANSKTITINLPNFNTDEEKEG